jgi:hypothetical protein
MAERRDAVPQIIVEWKIKKNTLPMPCNFVWNAITDLLSRCTRNVTHRTKPIMKNTTSICVTGVFSHYTLVLSSKCSNMKETDRIVRGKSRVGISRPSHGRLAGLVRLVKVLGMSVLLINRCVSTYFFLPVLVRLASQSFKRNIIESEACIECSWMILNKLDMVGERIAQRVSEGAPTHP